MDVVINKFINMLAFFQDKILEMRQLQMMVTKENTSKLKQMNAFCMEKMKLEAKLDALQNYLVCVTLFRNS